MPSLQIPFLPAASMASSLVIIPFFLLFLSFPPFSESAGSVGINYGRVADNLPSPEKVVALLQSQNITRVKLYDADSAVLTALANSNISVIIAMPNENLTSAATDLAFTDGWVQSNISPFHPATRIEAVAVGNEVFVDPNNVTDSLVHAMKNVYSSLLKLGLESDIKVSSPIALSSLGSSYPPSSGSFKTELAQSVISPMLAFLRNTSSYLMVNAYPFFAYSANADVISLDYALFRDNPGVVDSGSGLTYPNLLDAQIDAVFAAMSALQYDDVKMVITETGWPSKGDENEGGASVDNAASYNDNLVKRVLSGTGTPLKPNDPLNVIVFALFNEDLKPGPTSENNYGLFYPNQEKVYDVSFTLNNLNTTGSAPINSTGSAKARVGRTWSRGRAVP